MEKEILQEIGSQMKDVVKEKFRYTVVITYLIVWILFNWSLLFYLFFSKSSVEEKIIYINKEFLNYSNWCTIYYFFRNLFIAAVITFIFPVVQIGINYLTRSFYKIDKKTDEIKSGAEFIKKYKELELEIIALNSEFDNASIVVEQLREKNKFLIEKNKELQEYVDEHQRIIQKGLASHRPIIHGKS